MLKKNDICKCNCCYDNKGYCVVRIIRTKPYEKQSILCNVEQISSADDSWCEPDDDINSAFLTKLSKIEMELMNYDKEI